jgi:pimeloyl-ACP methyl ester carboxylesterase
MARAVLLVLAVLGGAAAALSLWGAPAIAAGALLHRSQTPLYRARPHTCADATFGGDGVLLQGWRCAPTVPRRAAIVYLHGIGDNRSGAAGVVERFGPQGFEVVAYDSRAHGQSEGAVCTYGIRERDDLRRVIATIPAGPVILVGSSLGAAVAVQTASIEPRVHGVVAAEVFADLRSVAAERGRRMGLPPWTVARALPIAEQRAGFRVDDASPVAAARLVKVPVLLLHGAEDRETPPHHSKHVYEALAGSRTLIVVPGAGHNQTLAAPGVWDRVETWIRHLPFNPESRIPNPESRIPSPEPRVPSP